MSDRHDYFFRQKVTEAELDSGFNFKEAADFNQNVDSDLVGVFTGQVVGEHTPNDVSVDITLGTSYSKQGERINVPTNQLGIDVSVDESLVATEPPPGFARIVSVFVEFDRSLTDSRTDGNSATVFFLRSESFKFVVRQGADFADPGSPGGGDFPAIDVNLVLLADITRHNADFTIVNADIDEFGVRRESAFVLTKGGASIRAGTAEEAIQAVLDALDDAAEIDYNAATLPVPAVWTAAAAATNVQAAIDGIIGDLSEDTTDDGATLVGAEVSGNLAQGTVRSQLDELDSEKGGLASINIWTSTNDFDSARITDENSLSDIGADDDAARNTPIIDTTTTTVGGNNDKKLLWSIPNTGGAFLRMYAMGNGFDFTRNAVWDNAANTWSRDAAADSHLWRHSVNNGWEYIERLSAEADGWVDTGWFIAGRRTGFGLASPGELIVVEDEGVLAPGPSNDTYSALKAVNRGSVVTEAVGSHVGYGFTFPGNPSSAAKTVIVETNMGSAPAGANFRPNGMAVNGVTIVGPTTWLWEVTFDVS